MSTETSKTERVEVPWKGSLRLVESKTILAERCIWYLLLGPFETELLGYNPACRQVAHFEGHFLEGLMRQCMDQYHFFSYAASFWTTHFREADIPAHSETMQLTFKLCNTRAKCFRTWFHVYWLLSKETTERPIHYTDL